MTDTERHYILGIDTSNYTTSVALIDDYFRIIEDRRLSIKVSEGMKGIRQSEALFQHMDNLPVLFETIFDSYRTKIKGICASSRPRPLDGSYMPVFKAGTNYSKIIADALGIPLHLTSHQEGHIEAGLYETELSHNDDFAVFHLSGGTTEILYNSRIIGGSGDISLGQLIDRIGVESGFSFPAGPKLDKLACEYLKKVESYDIIKTAALEKFKYISQDGLYINLSGLDTQIKRMLAEKDEKLCIDELVACVFYLIGQCLKTLTIDLKKQYNVRSVLYVGGVSSSKFIRDFLTENMECDKSEMFFSKPELSGDNAVGIAIIGGRKEWHSSR